MADKATLLQSVPPVANKTSTASPTRSDTPTGTRMGTELQTDNGLSISSFQAATYASYVLSFILAGFAAVVLFRKAMDMAEQRLSHSSKALAGAFVLMSLHGFFATYIYTRHLRGDIDAAPVSLTLLFWLVIGVTVGYLSNRLLILKDKIKLAEAITDGLFLGLVFALATLAVSPATNANLSLILSLIALVLYTIPLARFFIAFKSVKFRHVELQQPPIQRLLYCLIFIPALTALFSVLYVFKAIGPDAMLFVTNLMSLSFVLLISIFMLGTIKGSKEQAVQTLTEELPPAATMDPLVQELLAEVEASKAQATVEPKAPPPRQIRPATSPKVEPPARPGVPKKPGIPPPKPSELHSNQPKAPKKPMSGNKGSSKPAPNTPPTIKAPAKPKKRI